MKHIPLVHVTDLYHPPQDPDDQIDLATVAALPEYDLKGVVLDITQRFLEPAPAGFDLARDPGYVLVTQLAHLLGRPIPVAMGPTTPLSDPTDDARNQPLHEQGGIQLLLETLEASPDPVVISCVGSTRTITAAFNRAPKLLRAKTRTILLNAGSTAGRKQEWNVGLDPAAYVGLWRSGLPIDWYPCATDRSAFDRKHPRGTHWRVRHADLFKGLAAPWRAWFAYGFTGSARGDIIRALDDLGRGAVWEHVLAGSRNLWSTASLVMQTGRRLAKTAKGWRFVSGGTQAAKDVYPWRRDPIAAAVRDDATVDWQATDRKTPYTLFGREEGLTYGKAMTEALNALLCSLPVRDK